MNIVLDAMGSDRHPAPEIEAAHQAAGRWNDPITLAGPRTLLEPQITDPRIHIAHASQQVEATDKPSEAARDKPDSSMAVGVGMVKERSADAFITAGNTGGALATALFGLGRIRGVRRPALAPVFPVRDGSAVVLDIGANTECRPEFLLQFAVMGSVYAELVLGRQRPRVGLLSSGEEQGKGNDLVKETEPLLESSPLNYIGNVEPKELFGGAADVVVTDGFSGNVLLKTSEAVAALLMDTIRDEIRSGPVTAAGGVLAKPAFDRVSVILDPAEHGAAILLGVDGLVFSAHGRSNSRALFNAVRVARTAVESDLMAALRSALEPALEESV